MAKTYLNRNDLPRGIRNNNPGNLVYTTISWNGKVSYAQNKDWSGNPTNVLKHFEQFTELRYGIRALMRDIYNDHTKGLKTVSQLINEFAPAFENNTAAYINSVINTIGGNIIGELTQEKMIAIAKAIVLVENGKSYTGYITDQDYKDAIAILGIPLKKKVV
jgi:hypothetical protein